MTPEFDEEVVFEVGAGRPGAGWAQVSSPIIAPRAPGAACTGRVRVEAGSEAGAEPGPGQRLPRAGGVGRDRRGRRVGAVLGVSRAPEQPGASGAPSAQAEGGTAQRGRAILCAAVPRCPAPLSGGRGGRCRQARGGGGSLRAAREQRSGCGAAPGQPG